MQLEEIQAENCPAAAVCRKGNPSRAARGVLFVTGSVLRKATFQFHGILRSGPALVTIRGGRSQGRYNSI